MATTKKPTTKAPKPVTDKARIQRILDGLDQHYHGMETALDYHSDFSLLIAVMLSAQTTDVYVNKVTPGLFARYPTPEAMAQADLAEVERLIGGVSFYKTKAKNVITTSRILVEQYGGKVPADHGALTAMPGVGNKTANVVVSTLFKIPAIAVDTHVFRVSNRLGLATAKDVEETERQLQRAIPKDKWYEAHHWLIWHGRKICKAPTPRCETCFLTADCRYYQTMAATQAPGKTVTKTAAKRADGSATSPNTARTHTAATARAASGTTDGQPAVTPDVPPPAKGKAAKPATGSKRRHQTP
jgi:endonuclease-3